MNRLRGIPNPEFARKLLIDGTLLWIFIRIALPLISSVLSDTLGTPGLSLGLPGSVTLATLCGAIIVLDVRRRRENVLLANLGIPLRAVFLTGAIPAMIGETATSLLAAATGL